MRVQVGVSIVRALAATSSDMPPASLLAGSLLVIAA